MSGCFQPKAVIDLLEMDVQLSQVALGQVWRAITLPDIANV